MSDVILLNKSITQLLVRLPGCTNGIQGNDNFYVVAGDDLEPLKQTKYAPRRRKAQSEWQGPVSIHQANSAQLDHMAEGAGIKVQRRSIKRMSLARLRKTSEFSGLRQPGQGQPAQNGNGELEDGLDDVEEHRKIKGLKHSKVPMMVYSHGGFSRCFRIGKSAFVQFFRVPLFSSFFMCADKDAHD